MATKQDSRIDDPDGFLTGRIVDPESLVTTRADSVERNTGAGDSGTDTGTDSSDGVRRNKDGSVAKKRGRKPGSGNNRNAQQRKNPASVKGIEKILLSGHMMLAGFLKTPELILDESEAAMLANAAQSVQDFYNFETSAEVMLWMHVAGICGAVYGPRIMAMMIRRKANKPEKKQAPQPVTPADTARPIDLAEGFTIPHHAPTE